MTWQLSNTERKVVFDHRVMLAKTLILRCHNRSDNTSLIQTACGSTNANLYNHICTIIIVNWCSWAVINTKICTEHRRRVVSSVYTVCAAAASTVHCNSQGDSMIHNNANDTRAIKHNVSINHAVCLSVQLFLITWRHKTLPSVGKCYKMQHRDGLMVKNVNAMSRDTKHWQHISLAALLSGTINCSLIAIRHIAKFSLQLLRVEQEHTLLRLRNNRKMLAYLYTTK